MLPRFLVITFFLHTNFLSTITCYFEVIPIYFGLMTLASFYKKIDRFGFQHIVGNTTAKDACNSMGYASYFHEYFLRGRPWLCKSITKMKLQKSDGDRATRNNRSTKLSAPYKQTHQSGFDEDPIMEEDLIRASRIRSLPAIGPRSTNNPYQSSLLSIDAFIQKHGPKARILAGLCNIRCPLTLADEELASSESCPAIAIAMAATPAATTTEGSDTSEILNGNAREAFGESNTKPSKEMPKIHNEKHNDADQNFSETNCTASKLQQKGCENIVTWGPVNRTSHQGSQHHHHQEIPLEHNITLLQCLEELQKQIQLHNNAPIAVNTNQNEQHGLHQQVHSHVSRQFQTQHDNRVDVHIQAPNRNIANMLQPSTWDVSAVANINNILTTSSNSNIPQQQHQISSQHQTLQGGGGNDPNNNVAQHFGFQRTYAANVEDLARQILASTVVQTNTYTPTATSQQFYPNNIYLPTSLGRNNSVHSFNNIHPAMDAEFQRLLSRAINSGVIQGAASTTMNSKKNN